MAGNYENNGIKKAGRRKWSLLRGSAGLFPGIGTDLSEESCPNDQFNLAKELLGKHRDSASDNAENAREGIYWLVKASEQGHIEATYLLKECLESGKGITEHNVSEVLECIKTSTNEKLSVKAMRCLFLKCSEGEEFITNCQLLKRLSEVEDANGESKELPQIEDEKYRYEDWRVKDELYHDKLTEDELVSAARMYARGVLPHIGQSVAVSKRNSYKLLSIRSLYRILLFPFVIDRLSSYLLSFDLRMVISMLYLSPTHFKLLSLLFLFNTVQFEIIVSSLPTICYYSSFIIMVAATCHMLQYRQYFRKFRRWSNLFLLYGGKKFSAEEAEFLHCRNGFPSYVSFFLCLLVNLFVLSSFTRTSFFQAEITFVSFFFTVFTLVSFTFSKSRYMTYERGIDYLALLSFMLHVLAKYPYETDSVVGVGWRFLDLRMSTFASYVVGHGIEFCLNFRVVFYLIIPAVLFKMAARHQWRGIYSDLIPHCVTLSWWQLTLIYAQDITWYSLIRPALAFAGVVFFLPLTALASILLPFYALSKYLVEYDLWTTLITTCITSTCVPIIVFKTFSNRFPRRWNCYVICQIIFTILAAGLLLFHSTSSLVSSLQNTFTEIRSIEPDEFASYCNSFQTAPTDVARIESQMLCSQMAGLSVHWKGKVRKTEITNIYNPVFLILNKLPRFLSKYIYCFIGEEYSLCSDSFRVSFCKSLSQSCHLSNWNSYEMQIKVDIYLENGEVLPVVLIANNNFVNITRRLNIDDDVWFNGMIISDKNGFVNAHSPTVQLTRLTCVSCLEADLTETIDGIQISSMHFYNFIKYLFNFFLNPVFVLK